METIDRAKAWELIDNLIAKRGANFVYRQVAYDAPAPCVYAYNGAPSCAVGQMVYDLDPSPRTIEFMVELDEEHAGSSDFASRAGNFEEYLGMEFDEDAHDMFAEFQSRQDIGQQYGNIVKHLAAMFPREEK